MAEALIEARRAEALDEVPVGAVVVVGDRLIGRGHNRSFTDRDPTAHAEVVALREAARVVTSPHLRGATLYVTLEPCLMCCGALFEARLSRLVFGAREPRGGAVVSRHDTLMGSIRRPHVAVAEGVCGDDCAALLQRFFRARRAVPASRSPDRS